MRFVVRAFIAVILFKVAWLAINYAHPVPVQLAVFALLTSLLAIRFFLASIGLPRKCSINQLPWRE